MTVSVQNSWKRISARMDKMSTNKVLGLLSLSFGFLLGCDSSDELGQPALCTGLLPMQGIFIDRLFAWSIT